MLKSDSVKSLAVAMCKAQAQMTGAVKSATNPFFKKNYADLGSVVEAIKKPFSDNGLSYVQFPIEDNGRIGIETILLHDSGEWLSNSFTVPITKQDAQGAGSALTYCRRYSLQAVAGIPCEDDDGNATVNNESQPQPETNWYNGFDKQRGQMLAKIQSGEQTPDGIIDSLVKCGYAISTKTRLDIKGLK